MMENPLELAAPPESEPIERIHALAKDMAYGAVHKMWTAHFRVNQPDGQAKIDDDGLNRGLSHKWGDYHNYYAVPLLFSFGYLARSSPGDGSYFTRDTALYDITQKAFNLLGTPAIAPKVFISYKQD